MALPAGIPSVRVHGTYAAPNGAPLSGTITFGVPALLTFSTANVFLAGPVAVKLDENGSFSVDLPATDNPDMNPTGWTYSVKENLTGVVGTRSYALNLPEALGEIDLADVAPADPATPNYTPIPGLSAYDVAVSNGFAGTQAQWLATLIGPPGSVDTVNGKPGPSPVLNAADVGALAMSGDYTTQRNVKLNGPALNYRALGFATNGLDRWLVQADDTAESGSNAGSNFRITSRDDSGALKSTMIYGQRSSGNMGIGTPGVTAGARLTINGATALMDVASDPAAVAGNAFVYSKNGKAYARQADGTVVPLVPQFEGPWMSWNNDGGSIVASTTSTTYVETMSGATGYPLRTVFTTGPLTTAIVISIGAQLSNTGDAYGAWMSATLRTGLDGTGTVIQGTSDDRAACGYGARRMSTMHTWRVAVSPNTTYNVAPSFRNSALSSDSGSGTANFDSVWVRVEQVVPAAS